MKNRTLGLIGFLSLAVVFLFPSVSLADTETYFATTVGQYLCTTGMGLSTWNSPFIDSGASWATSRGAPSGDVSNYRSAAVSFFDIATPSSKSSAGSSGNLSWNLYMEQGSETDQVPCYGEVIVTYATSPQNGICGSAQGTTADTQPYGSAACTQVTFSDTSDTSTEWRWSCSGSGGGSTASCFAYKNPNPVPGICGSAQGTTASSQPTGLAACTQVTFSDVADTSTQWLWNCLGSGGGSTASCSANKSSALINGQCGPSSGTNQLSEPTGSSACTPGTYSNTPSDTSTQFKWSCVGSGGGTTDSSCFANKLYTLTTAVGSGSGTVTGTGISCPGDCIQDFTAGTWITIFATPSSGYGFSNWSGACAGQGASCSLQMNSNLSTTANFGSLSSYALTVNSSVGAGVPINGSPLVYGGTTNYTKTNITSGTNLSLTPLNPYNTYNFSSWTGCNSVSGSVCNLSMTSNKTVTANYVPATLSISASASPTSGNSPLNNVSVSANVSGTATGVIQYRLDCTDDGTWDDTFVSSSNSHTFGVLCSYPSAGTYTVRTRAVRQGLVASDTVTVSVTNTTYTLTVNSSGASGVAIVGSPSTYSGTTNYTKAGIAAGTSFIITAPSTAGTNNFVNWTGCSSTNGPNCTITSINSNKTVTANYTPITLSVSASASPSSGLAPLNDVSITADVSGTATGNIRYRINCDKSDAVFDLDITNSLDPYTASDLCDYATPGTYTVRTRADRQGIFAVTDTDVTVGTATYILSTSISSGSGTITGPGIGCPGDCSESYANGTWVTLVATPGYGYDFDSWSSGACAGQSSSCSIQINADTATAASFVSAPAFNYSLSNSGDINVTKAETDVYAQNTVTKNLISGTTQPVTLSLSGVPSGVSYSISGSSCSPTCASTITFTVTPSATVGNHALTVTGSPLLNKKTSFSLNISGSPIVVSCSGSPSTVLLGQPVTWTASVTGGTPPYTYLWSGTDFPNPGPTTNPFSKNYSTVGQKIASVSVTDDDSAVAICPSSSIQVNFDPSFEEF